MKRHTKFLPECVPLQVKTYIKKQMKKTIMMAAALAGTAFFLSCKSSKDALATSALEGEWNITAVDSQKAEAEKEVFIGFDLQKKSIYGCAGCNRIMGSLEADTLKPGTIAFRKLGSTRMICQDMATETAVMAALKEVTGYSGTPEEITLTGKHGKALLTLEKRTASRIESLNGEWLITEVEGTSIATLGKTEKAPFLNFNANEKQVHGFAGCNIVNGSFSQEEGQPASLKFKQMISTMMAGPGLEVERKVLGALNSVHCFEAVSETQIVLKDANGKAVITLTRK